MARAAPGGHLVSRALLHGRLHDNAEQRLVYTNGTAREILLHAEAAQGMPLEEVLHERVKAIGPSWLEERMRR